MRYLKNDYLFPIVERSEFKRVLGATYVGRAAASKLIIKGLTLLDAAIDEDASFIPGKTTLVIAVEDPVTLKFLAGVLNSRLISFYIKQKYASASYNGGVNFTPDMINAIPVPRRLDKEAVAEQVTRILRVYSNIQKATADLFSGVRASAPGGRVRYAMFGDQPSRAESTIHRFGNTGQRQEADCVLPLRIDG